MHVIELNSKLLKYVIFHSNRFLVHSCLGKLLQNASYMFRMFDSLNKVLWIINKCGYMWLNGAVCSGKSLNLTLFYISLYDNILWLINWWIELVVGWFEDNIMSVRGLVVRCKWGGRLGCELTAIMWIARPYVAHCVELIMKCLIWYM